MPRRASPPAEVDVTESLVRALLEEQHPDLAALPLTAAGAGWDNALFRLGDSFAVRLPRRAVAEPGLLNEQRWLPQLAPRLPLPVPAAVRLGVPGCGYPWSWSVTPWFEGRVIEGPTLGHKAATTLGQFLAALHVPAPSDAPVSPFRSVALASRDERLRSNVADLEGIVDGGRVLRCWDEWRRATPWPGPPLWVHGDLHPYNVLVSGDDFAAVIDFGDVCAGDPAVDLAAGWMLFAAAARATFRAAYRQEAVDDEQLWIRARGWALVLNLVWLVQAADDEPTTRQTLATIEGLVGGD
ncbi:MAG: aminoglycoside phosphotransferase family protein [Vicinamibacterales bacterium]